MLPLWRVHVKLDERELGTLGELYLFARVLRSALVRTSERSLLELVAEASPSGTVFIMGP